MELSRDSSKESQIISVLCQKIRSGEFCDGQRLQSVRILAKEFQTSLSVVNRAFDSLEKLDLLERRPRSGVFVRSPQSPPRKAALILDYLQDIHALFPSIMQRLLAQADYLVTLFDTNVVRDNPRLFYQFLAEEPNLIVFDGWYYFPTEILSKIPKTCRCVCFHRCEIDLPPGFTCAKVLADMFQVGYQAINRLLEQGKTHPLILHPEFFRPDASAKVFLDGALQALSEAGLSPAKAMTVIDAPDQDLLRQVLDSTPCDCAIGSDFIVKELLLQATKLNLRIPEDFAVIGCYNTPWSESYHFPSLDLQPDLMASRVVTVASHHDNSRTYIPPRIETH